MIADVKLSRFDRENRLDMPFGAHGICNLKKHCTCCPTSLGVSAELPLPSSFTRGTVGMSFVLPLVYKIHCLGHGPAKPVSPIPRPRPSSAENGLIRKSPNGRGNPGKLPDQKNRVSATNHPVWGGHSMESRGSILNFSLLIMGRDWSLFYWCVYSWQLSEAWLQKMLVADGGFVTVNKDFITG